jgi:hypothetical protein
MFKWYGSVPRISDNGRREKTTYVVAGKKKKRKRTKNMWEMEVRRVIKQKNLRLEDIVNRSLAKSDSEPIIGATMENSYGYTEINCFD